MTLASLGTALLIVPLVVAPFVFARWAWQRLPTPGALVALLVLWGLGNVVIDPDTAAPFEVPSSIGVFTELRPRWRGVLGGTMRLVGFFALLGLITRSIRRYRRRGTVETTYHAPPVADPCPHCGATVRTEERRCRRCGKAYWRPEDEEG